MLNSCQHKKSFNDKFLVVNVEHQMVLIKGRSEGKFGITICRSEKSYGQHGICYGQLSI